MMYVCMFLCVSRYIIDKNASIFYFKSGFRYQIKFGWYFQEVKIKNVKYFSKLIVKIKIKYEILEYLLNVIDI